MNNQKDLQTNNEKKLYVTTKQELKTAMRIVAKNLKINLKDVTNSILEAGIFDYKFKAIPYEDKYKSLLEIEGVEDYLLDYFKNTIESTAAKFENENFRNKDDICSVTGNLAAAIFRKKEFIIQFSRESIYTAIRSMLMDYDKSKLSKKQIFLANAICDLLIARSIESSDNKNKDKNIYILRRINEKDIDTIEVEIFDLETSVELENVIIKYSEGYTTLSGEKDENFTRKFEDVYTDISKLENEIELLFGITKGQIEITCL
jgi:hypothetical protein